MTDTQEINVFFYYNIIDKQQYMNEMLHNVGQDIFYGVWALMYWLCLSRQILSFNPRFGFKQTIYFIHNSAF